MLLNNASRASPTPKGVIYGISKIIIHEHFWLIDGHFYIIKHHSILQEKAATLSQPQTTNKCNCRVCVVRHNIGEAHPND